MREKRTAPDRVSVVPYVLSNYVEKPDEKGIIFNGILFKGVIKKAAFHLHGEKGEFTFNCTLTNDEGSQLIIRKTKRTAGVMDLDISVIDGEQLVISCTDQISDVAISIYVESERKIKVGR